MNKETLTNQAKHKAQTISGLKWTVLDQTINQITVFGIGILLMQLLPPSSFGLLGMVTVFSGFLSVFKDFGLGSSLIQKKNINMIETNTVYWFTVLIGLLLTLSLYQLSPLIAQYYGEPSLSKIAKVISPIFFIQSLSSVQLDLMRKHMLFKQIFVVQVSSTFLSGLTALVLAYSGYGVWALVFQIIISSVTTTVFIFLAKSFVPGFIVKKESLNEHLNFSLPLVGRGALNYWSRNADNFFIGSYLGAELLGVYTRSYSLMMIPISRISGVISSVMFPSLAQIQHEEERVVTIFLKMVRLISQVTLPIMLIVAIASDYLVEFFFGDEWSLMAEILPFLAIIGAMQSLGTVNANIFMLKNKNVLALKLNVMNSFCYVMGFYISAKYGLKELVTTYLITNTFLRFINWSYLASLLNIGMIDLWRNIQTPVLSFFVLLILGRYSLEYLVICNDLLMLFIVTLCVALFWVLIHYIFNKEQLFEMRDVMQDLNKRGGR